MKRGVKSKEHMCADAPNKNLCLPKSYSKFELPFTESVNVVEIGIDIIDVLRINDKVRIYLFIYTHWHTSFIISNSFNQVIDQTKLWPKKSLAN